MITVLSNSVTQQHSVSRLTWHVTIKGVSADSSCSVVWWGARAACTEVSAGSVETWKAKLGLKGLLDYMLQKCMEGKNKDLGFALPRQFTALWLEAPNALAPLALDGNRSYYFISRILHSIVIRNGAHVLQPLGV
jgi:hypothetical protein